MGYTDPKTWSVGETLPAANFNTHIRDNFISMGPHLVARKTADQSVTSSTGFVNDNHLLIPVEANEIWHMEWGILFSGHASGDFKVGWDFPSGGEIAFSVIGDNSSAVTTYWPIWYNGTPPTTSSLYTFNCLGVGLKTFILIHGVYSNGGSAGDVTFRWGQNTSNATATVVHQNSFARGVKLA